MKKEVYFFWRCSFWESEKVCESGKVAGNWVKKKKEEGEKVWFDRRSD